MEGDDEDVYKVWEIRAQDHRPGYQEAEKMLHRIADQVQPIMRYHKWQVKLLSETCLPHIYGSNSEHGNHVKLRLRSKIPFCDWVPFPFDHVLDTMLHELCHNAITPHDSSFDELLDQIRKECAELRAKGINGPGRLIGGDKSVMSALSPTQAAVIAAERRLQDKIQCASESELSEFQGTDFNTCTKQRIGTWGRKKTGIYVKGSSSSTPRFGTWGRRKILKCVKGNSSAATTPQKIGIWG